MVGGLFLPFTHNPALRSGTLVLIGHPSYRSRLRWAMAAAMAALYVAVSVGVGAAVWAVRRRYDWWDSAGAHTGGGARLGGGDHIGHDGSGDGGFSGGNAGWDNAAPPRGGGTAARREGWGSKRWWRRGGRGGGEPWPHAAAATAAAPVTGSTAAATAGLTNTAPAGALTWPRHADGTAPPDVPRPSACWHPAAVGVGGGT